MKNQSKASKWIPPILFVVILLVMVVMNPDGPMAGLHAMLLVVLYGAAVVVALLLLIFIVLCFKYPHLPRSFLRSIQTGVLFRPKIWKEHERILTILQHENDPERYIREMEALLKREGIPKGIHQNAASNLAAGYFANGEIQRALEIWKREAADEKKMRDPSARTIMDLNLCAAYLELGNPEQARVYYDRLVAASQVNKHPLKAWLVLELPGLDAKFYLAEGRYKKARNRMERFVDEGKGSVHNHFDLASIYEKVGDTRSQRRHLERVVELGNLHYKARIARAKLEELPEELLPEAEAELGEEVE